MPRPCTESIIALPSFNNGSSPLCIQSSLIAQDNDLFRQLLSLHDSIAELRERQRHSSFDDELEDDELEDELNDDHRHKCLSLESLSDPGLEPETSPESTLSSRSSRSADSSGYCQSELWKSTKGSRCSNSSDYVKSSCKHHYRNRYRKSDQTKSNGDSRPLVFIDKSEICFRCRKMAPPYRRSSSITSLYYLHEDMESYDSGIHLQGSHSDSDHEIFV
ncbi:hypothetical protein JTE90_005540 [Oedothorax gibbosus]|uniref:Uncharacterized protein n=1 Tax=Oedothorax gibbosus TaxID=931172 RepID=A0AAV6VB58_9ARAC|nr:hypothetical protein JTE90_005540 [Oedothorax gibbosus]